jgi:hypothetical protein
VVLGHFLMSCPFLSLFSVDGGKFHEIIKEFGPSPTGVREWVLSHCHKQDHELNLYHVFKRFFLDCECQQYKFF